MINHLESIVSEKYATLHQELRNSSNKEMKTTYLTNLMEEFALTRNLTLSAGEYSTHLKLVSKKAEWDIRNILNKINESTDLDRFGIEPHDTVVHCHRGGLCNRLRTACAVATASEFLSFNQPNVIWVKDDACPENFQNIFDISSSMIPFHILKEKEYRELVDGKNSLRIHNLYTPWNIWNTYLKAKVSWNIFSVRYTEIISNLFKASRSSILGKTSSYAKEIRKSKSIGIHLRRGDFVEHYKKTNGVDLASIKSLSEHCSKNFPGYLIYLACDDKKSSDEFIHLTRESSKNKIITNSSQYINEGKRQTSLEDSIVDLVSLGNCDEIIGTQGSSFSDMALTLLNGNLNSGTKKFDTIKLTGLVFSGNI